MTDNKPVLRLLILLVCVTTGLTMYAGIRLEQTLPPPLVTYVQSRSTAELSTVQAAAGMATIVLLGMLIAGLAGMWWCRRWGRLAFTIAALGFPVLTVVSGLADPASLISNALESGANTASDMSIGATLALVWLGMEADFSVNPGRQSNTA